MYDGELKLFIDCYNILIIWDETVIFPLHNRSCNGQNGSVQLIKILAGLENCSIHLTFGNSCRLHMMILCSVMIFQENVYTNR